MRLFLPVIAAVCATLAIPAMAAGATDASTMTCANFMAMDDAGQMQALDALKMAATQGDTMSSDDMSADSGSSGSMSAGSGSTASGNASDGSMASDAINNETVTAMAAACDGHPDMMAMDVLMPHG